MPGTKERVFEIAGKEVRLFQIDPADANLVMEDDAPAEAKIIDHFKKQGIEDKKAKRWSVYVIPKEKIYVNGIRGLRSWCSLIEPGEENTPIVIIPNEEDIKKRLKNEENPYLFNEATPEEIEELKKRQRRVDDILKKVKDPEELLNLL